MLLLLCPFHEQSQFLLINICLECGATVPDYPIWLISLGIKELMEIYSDANTQIPEKRKQKIIKINRNND